MTVMSGELFRGGGGGGSEERVCITQHEQREYDACSLEPQEFPGGQQEQEQLAGSMSRSSWQEEGGRSLAGKGAGEAKQEHMFS